MSILFIAEITEKSKLNSKEYTQMRAFNCAANLMVLGVFLVSGANASDLSVDYISGRWVIDAKSCSSSTSEYIGFNKNGTFVGTRTGIAEVVGFWGINEDSIELHMVTSPASFHDLNKDLAKFDGIYSYFEGKMLIFNNKEKSFEAYGVVGKEIKRTLAVRCP
jgi:hypothetical protein